MNPVNMVATILARHSGGCEFGRQRDVEREGAAHADAGQEAEDAEGLEVMHPVKPAVEYGEHKETQNKGGLPANAVGEHAQSCRTYHKAYETVGDNRACSNGGQVPLLDDIGHHVGKDLRIIAVEQERQYPEDQKIPMETIEFQFVAKFRHIRCSHGASLYHLLVRFAWEPGQPLPA